MRNLRTIIIVLAMALSVAVCTGARADSLSGADYVMGADDVIDVFVSNHDDLNKESTIRPDGKITLARVGDIMAAGKTAQALAAQLEKLYSKWYNHAPVTVAVKAVRSRRARIVGAVKTAGTYELKTGWHFMDLVAVAGGLSTKPVRISGHVVRAGRVMPFNVEQANAKPDGVDNLLLKPDDLVVLDEQDITKQVTIIGQVGKPGAYDLEEGLNPVSLVAQAGGPIEGALLSRAYVLRGTTQLPLNLKAVLEEQKEDPTVTGFKFLPGDALVIPQNLSRYGVMGKVGKPNYYPFPEKSSDATVLKALALAGGQTPEGDIRNATITRITNGQATSMPVNIEALLSGQVADIPLQVDDVLYLPEANDIVNVSGEVKNQGPYKLTSSTTLVSLVGAAGGQLESAALRQAYVARDGKQIPINLYAAIVNGANDPVVSQFKLRPGDQLVIPKSTLQYAVMGEVRLAGKFYFPDTGRATVVDALSSAGGQTATGDLKRAYIVRIVNGQTAVTPLDLNSMKKGGPGLNLELKPQDVLYIPSKKAPVNIASYLGPLALLF